MNARKPDPPSVSGKDEEEEGKKRERAAARQRKSRAKKKAKEAAAAEAATRASTPAQAPALAYASTLARTTSSNAERLEKFATWSLKLAATINESHAETMRTQTEFLGSALKTYGYIALDGGAPPTTERSHRNAFSSPSCESGDTTESE